MLIYNRDLRSVHITGTSTACGTAEGNRILLSIPGMPDKAVLKQIRIFSADLTTVASNAVDIQIITNPARYIAAETASAGTGEPYVVMSLNAETSETGPNTLWLSDTIFDPPLEYDDALSSNMLHILFKVDAGKTLSHTAAFRVDIWADGLPELWPSQHQTDHTIHDPTNLNIYRWATGDLWTDLSTQAKNELDNYSSAALKLWNATTDYIYFGATEQFLGLWFNVASANTTTGITDTWEYYDGSTWSTLTIYDNCSNHDSTGESLFSHDGVMEWDAPSDWANVDISTLSIGDPPYDYIYPLGQYGVFPTSYTPLYDKKYWIRANIDDVTTSPTFKWVRVKPTI